MERHLLRMILAVFWRQHALECGIIEKRSIQQLPEAHQGLGLLPCWAASLRLSSACTAMLLLYCAVEAGQLSWGLKHRMFA